MELLSYPLISNFDFDENLQNYVKEKMQDYNDPSHDYNHILRVVYTIMNHPESTIESILVGFIHDLFDSKFINNQEKLIKRTVEVKKLLLSQSINYLFYAYDSILPHNVETIEKLIMIAKEISWSKYNKTGIPTFKNDDKMIKIWKLVSNSDWLDSIYLVRIRDHAKYRNPNITKKELKDEVINHWEEKCSILYKHSFDDYFEKKMKELTKQQESILKIII